MSNFFNHHFFFHFEIYPSNLRIFEVKEIGGRKERQSPRLRTGYKIFSPPCRSNSILLSFFTPPCTSIPGENLGTINKTPLCVIVSAAGSAIFIYRVSSSTFFYFLISKFHFLELII